MKSAIFAFVTLAASLVAAVPQRTGPPTDPPTNPPKTPPGGPPKTPPGSVRPSPPGRNFYMQIDAPDWDGDKGVHRLWVRPEADRKLGINWLTVANSGESATPYFRFSDMWKNGIGNVNYQVSGVTLWAGFQKVDLRNETKNEVPAFLSNVIERGSGRDEKMWWLEDSFFAQDGHFWRAPKEAPGAQDKWALCWVEIPDPRGSGRTVDRLALHWYYVKEKMNPDYCWPIRLNVGGRV